MSPTDLFSPTSPALALFCVFIAFATSWVIQRFVGKPLTHARYQTIDGLRGYLAFFVFLHHASIWFYYLRGHGWKAQPSNVFAHFGQSSVALFFMITAFLFVTKLLDSRKSGLDWRHLYLSRFLRLAPLYMFAMAILFLIVAILSHGKLQESGAQVFSEALTWVLFTIGGAPDINGVANTALIVAGVTWSLPYEWLFYFGLPILALLLGTRPTLLYLGLGLLLAGLMIYSWHPDMSVVRCFYGGLAAAFFARVPWLRKFAVTPWASSLALIALLYAVTKFTTAYTSHAQILLSIAFVLIASGCDFFGLLKNETSKTLGEMAYSIYLLHGLLLYLVFDGLIGFNQAKSLSPEAHWLTVIAVSPILVCLSFLTYRLIEKPCMEVAQKYRANRR